MAALRALGGGDPDPAVGTGIVVDERSRLNNRQALCLQDADGRFGAIGVGPVRPAEPEEVLLEPARRVAVGHIDEEDAVGFEPSTDLAEQTAPLLAWYVRDDVKSNDRIEHICVERLIEDVAQPKVAVRNVLGGELDLSGRHVDADVGVAFPEGRISAATGIPAPQPASRTDAPSGRVARSAAVLNRRGWVSGASFASRR